jgi:hypothetical protein
VIAELDAEFLRLMTVIDEGLDSIDRISGRRTAPPA